MLAAALEYARRGWPVFPLVPRTKNPGTPHGFQDATTDAVRIEEWWAHRPEANVGAATGPAMGVWVLDVDGREGARSLTRCEEALGPLPETLEQRTGSGGRQLFFEWPKRHAIRCRQGVRLPAWPVEEKTGLDVRGEGGYVVLPPSVHPDGGRYDWPCGPRGRIASAPDAWLRFLAPKQAPAAPEGPPAPWAASPSAVPEQILERARRYIAACPPAVQGAAGHNALMWAARALVVGFDLDDETALGLLWAEFNPRCVPPWNPEDGKDRRDLERKVAEARKTPGQKPRGWLLMQYGLPPPPEATSPQRRPVPAVAVAEKESTAREPFPVQHFPAPLRQYVEALADAQGVDLSYAALPVLAVAGAAMGNAWRLELKRGFVVPPILWVALVGPSGSNKSGPLRAVLAPLLEVLPDGAAGSRVVLADATLEAVLARLAAWPRGLLVFRDELAGWVRGFDAYHRGSGDEQTWVELWGGAPFLIDRKTSSPPHQAIPAASVSILGGIQPEIAMGLFSATRFASGLVPRFLLACPPDRHAAWSDAEVEERVEERWGRAVRWLRRQPFARVDGGPPMPRVVRLTEAAQAVYVRAFDELSHERAQADGGPARALISKSRVMAARLALIHHGLALACEEPVELAAPVSEASAEAGVAWARWCLAEALRLHGFSLEAPPPPPPPEPPEPKEPGRSRARRERSPELSEERLLALVARRHYLGPRELMVWNRRRFPTREAAEEVLRALVAQGRVFWAEEARCTVVAAPDATRLDVTGRDGKRPDVT